jgi:3-oxoacyl-[acyl-carrier-protein] synthase III
MATTIEAVRLVRGGWRSHSALRLAVAATQGALRQAGRKPGEADLLINAGLYHDRNLGEPALAPMIQGDAGINSSDPYPGGIGTFSFDVANGACGVLTALQIADGFLTSRTISTAVVVASDADPGHRLAADFPYDPAAGALVCQWSDGDRGLMSFCWHNDPDDGGKFRAEIALQGGRHVLVISEDPSFAEQAGKTAAVAAQDVLEKQGLSTKDVSLVVASPASRPFIDTLSRQLEVPEDRIVRSAGVLHTVAFVAALDVAVRTGRMGRGDIVLFACGASGLTAGAALYQT